MDKETLSNYGWIVICVLVLAVMIALAGPFGNFVADAVKSTAQGLFDVNQNALNSTGLINIRDQSFGSTNAESQPNNVKPDGVKITTNIVAWYDQIYVTGTYAYGDYIYNGTVISGNEFGASTVAEGREIVKTYYIPAMGMTWDEILGAVAAEGLTEEEAWASIGLTEDTFEPSVFGEWEVSLNDEVTDRNQTSYGPILESINGTPIKDISALFQSCSNLEVAPAIPSCVTDISFAFNFCRSLKTAPIIPDSVTSMSCAFQDCESLTEAPVLPKGLINMSYAFNGCTNLLSAPILPNNIDGLHATFQGCTNLKTYAGSTDSDGDFSKYYIPNTVRSMHATFSGCKAIVISPEIPEGVTGMSSAFRGCTSLKIGPSSIPKTVTDVYGMFWDCSSLVSSPTIPWTVKKDINYLFSGCTSLTGTVTINASPSTASSLEYYFEGVDFEAQNLTLAGSYGGLDTLGATGINYCKTCNGKCHRTH